MSKTPRGWNHTKYTDLYSSCLSEGHQPYVHSTSFRSVYLYCVEDQRFWRLQIDSLDWMPLDDWPGNPPTPPN